MNGFKSLLAGAMLLASCAAASAEEPAPDAAALITPDIREEISRWIDSDIVRLSITAQNERYGNLSSDEINALDQRWRAEREADDQPLIAAILSNPLSVYLTRMQGRSLGLYAEIFVMDRNGLNVGQSSITSDFWQGDEAKFQKTFPSGPGAVFIDEPEWDDGFGVWRAQINVTVADETGNKAIGAATIEINLTELARRKRAGS